MTLLDQGTKSMTLSQFVRLGRAIAVAAAALAVAAPAASAEEAVEKADGVVENTGDAVGKAEPAPDEKAAEKPAKAQTPAAGCDPRVFTRVFEPWRDRALYTLAPGGDFETQAEGWTLEAPAAIAADSAPFLLGAALGAGSLELPAGATAVSPPICVQRGFPSFRFLARSVSTDAGVLKVQVLYPGRKPKTTGRIKPAAEWAPTRKLSLAQGRFRTRRRGTALIQLRFAATAGTVRLDDVYVDPRYNR
jgi:hypothetical protein